MIKGIKPPTTVAKVFIVAILSGFAVMLVTSAVYRSNNPSLTKFVQATISAPAAEELQANKAAHIAELMGKLRADPTNAAVLSEIAQFFMESGEYSQARKFIQRSIVADPDNARQFYLLGMVNFKLKSYRKAAEAFRTSLALQDDPAARYNLGILLKYYLEKPEEAAAQFTMIINSKTAGKSVKAAAQKELNK
ncbi:MAG: hypothetical protein MI749_19560 [Desulfovibrionales bacterium]|nr:hypothetical protein [Desulfovibrionales bacterium]